VLLVGFYYKNTIKNIAENNEHNEARIIKMLNRILHNSTTKQQQITKKK